MVCHVIVIRNENLLFLVDEVFVQVLEVLAQVVSIATLMNLKVEVVLNGWPNRRVECETTLASTSLELRELNSLSLISPGLDRRSTPVGLKS